MPVENINLLLPASYDILWLSIAVALLGLFIVAFIRWTRVDFSGGSSAPLWLLVIALIPIIGPIAFLIQSRTMATKAKTSAQN